MSKSLLDYFDGSQRVVFHLQQGNLKFISPVDQLRQRLAGTREDQTLGGRF